MNERGKFLEHVSSFMYGADGLVGAHGPWIIFVRTISDRSGSKSLSGNSAHTTLWISSGWNVKPLVSHNRIWVCGSPRF